MADKMYGSDIVDGSVEVELNKVDKQLDILFDKFIKVAGGAKELNNALRNSNTTAEVTKTVNSYGSSLTELEKIKKQLIQQNEKLIASQTLEAQLLSELKARQVEENKTTREFIRDKKTQEGSIDQLNAKLIQMKRAYTELAAAERDASKGQQMLAHIQATRTEVGKLEATMGMYHKNVGNYTNATFQMTQVLREVPNFAQSAEIGIRSLSNNLPMLVESFQQVSKQAGGSLEALKIFGKSMLSISAIIPIALTLFIAYWEDIKKFATGTKEADKATQELAKSMASEIAQTKLLITIVQSANTSYEAKIAASNELLKLYPETLKNYKAEQIAAGDAADAIDRITASVIAHAKVKAIQSDIEKLAAKQYENEMVLAQENHKLFLLYAERDRLKPLTGQGSLINDATFADNEQKITDTKDLLASLRKENDSLSKSMENLAMKASTLLPKVLDETAPKKEKKPKKEKLFTVDIPDLAPTDEELKNIENYYKRLEESVKKYYKEYINTEDFKKALAQDELEMLADMDKLTTHKGDKTGGNAINLNNLLMGRRKQTKIDDREKEARTKSYFELIQNGIQAISTISNAVYDRENAQLTAKEKKMNDYYDQEERRVKQSGKTQAEQQEALAKLDAQREAQQKKIDQDRATAQRKAASRQKAIDILQIIANTALAVTAALKEGDPYTKIVRAAAAGVLGGAQLAAVIATPLPQYKDGIGIGNGEHKGGHAVVGDGGEHELIVEPSGKTYISPSKSTIMNLPAKTKVIPQHKLLQMVTDATHVSLANTSTPITEGMYINEMIAQYDKLASKVDNLTNVMEAKNLQTNIYSDYDHNLHVQKNRF